MTKRTIGVGTALLLWVVLINARPVYAQQPRVGDRQCGTEFMNAEARSMKDFLDRARASESMGFWTRLVDQPLALLEYGMNIAGNVGSAGVCIALR